MGTNVAARVRRVAERELYRQLNGLAARAKSACEDAAMREVGGTTYIGAAVNFPCEPIVRVPTVGDATTPPAPDRVHALFADNSCSHNGDYGKRRGKDTIRSWFVRGAGRVAGASPHPPWGPRRGRRRGTLFPQNHPPNFPRTRTSCGRRAEIPPAAHNFRSTRTNRRRPVGVRGPTPYTREMDGEPLFANSPSYTALCGSVG